MKLASDMIKINNKLTINDSELSFMYSRSPGPGGQNVNKTASRVTLNWDVLHSRSLSTQQRQRLLARLAPRISGDGLLRMVSHRHRTQVANRKDVLKRFTEIVSEALKTRPLRKKSRPTAASREVRLGAKRHRGRIKQQRRRPRSDD